MRKINNINCLVIEIYEKYKLLGEFIILGVMPLIFGFYQLGYCSHIKLLFLKSHV